MQRLQAYRYELMPSGDQQRHMHRFAGSCRFVFNKALALQAAHHAAGNKFIDYVEMAKLLPAWKAEFPWLREAPSQALQHSLKNLDRAFTNFFRKRSEYPRFKKRGRRDSFRFPQGFKLDQHGHAVGIDMGVVRLATLSDGTVFPPLNTFKRYAAALAKAEQAMNRKKKFSNNWKKAKARVQRIHARMANARRDYLHKVPGMPSAH